MNPLFESRRVAATCILSLTMMPALAKSDQCVQFDIPSAIEVCDVSNEAFAMANPDERLVEIQLPCSTLVECDKGIAVQQLMVHVRGLSTRYQVVEFLPQTQLHSNIDGPISVEQHRGKNASFGLDAGGTYNEAISLKGTAKAGTQNSTTERYQKVPDQQLLLASGTIDRGTGVYYKFRHSNQTTLEGSHVMVITLRVPMSWRGGLLRVDCEATGEEKYLIGTDDKYVAGKQSFMVALYLKGDRGAQILANRYVELESTIRRYAAAAGQRTDNRELITQISGLLGYQKAELPKNWANQVSLYSRDQFNSQIRPQLSEPLQAVADQYLAARRQLLLLNR